MRPALVVIALVGFMAASRGVAHARDDADLRGAEPPVYVVMPPPPEAAEPEPPPPPKEKLQNGGVEISVGTLFFKPSLGQNYFSGSGTPLGGARRENFHHLGREVGVDTPLMWGGELSISYVRRYFAVGVMGFLAGHPGSSDKPVPSFNNVASTDVNPSALFGYGGGLDFSGALPLGPVAIRAGGLIGARGFSVPMIGFEKKSCQSKHGTYPCYEDATTTALLFFEPRVRVEISPDPLSGLFFGGYVGMEVVGGSAPTAGLFFGFHTPHSMLMP